MPEITASGCTRRNFLAWSACAAGCAACPSALVAAPKTEISPAVPDVKTRLRVVYSHPVPELQGWPYQGFDYEKRKTEITARLKAALPKAEFLPVWVKNEQEADAVLKAGPDIDGYVVFLLGIPGNGGRAVAMSKRPVVLVDDLYGGTGSFLGTYGPAKRQGLPVVGVSSTRFEDVVEAVKTFECIKRLKSSTLLDVIDRKAPQIGTPYEELLGLRVKPLMAADLNEAYEKADAPEARKWAAKWTKEAQKVVEPSQEEIRKSASMYVGMRDLLSQNSAQGIAIDCLRLFYGGKMTAYPCLGFFQLNNEGLVGACEADLPSAATMLMMTYLTARPGYISDPVIDTSKNQIIYAHCVSSNRVYGPNGPANPYHIRSHSEDRKGASVRSLMPLNQMTTTLRLVPEQKGIVIHTAKTVANIDEDRACRTKLAAEPKDARKLMRDWQFGWHRVTVYGDVRTQVENAATLLGLKLIEEG